MDEIVRITLTRGQWAWCSEQDYPFLRQFNWCPNVKSETYAYASVKNLGSVYMHQLVILRMTGDWVPTGMYADHIDNNSLNNSRSNLRVVTQSVNLQNRRKRKAGCSSDYRGVSWDASRGLWVVKMKIHGKETWIGRFEDEDEAARAYNDAIGELYEEPTLNVVGEPF